MTERQNIPQAVEAALHQILGYLYSAEESDFEENPDEGHIFLALRIVNEWLNEAR